jgi:Spy/CpxP family protein refolding chaperone
MRVLRALALTAVIVAVSATAASAHRWSGSDHGLIARLVRGGELTDTQKDQARQIFAAHREQLRALRAQLRTASEALQARMYGPDALTAADVAPLVEQIEQLRGQLVQERLEVALEIRNLLTPEQLSKAAQFRPHRHHGPRGPRDAR